MKFLTTLALLSIVSTQAETQAETEHQIQAETQAQIQAETQSQTQAHLQVEPVACLNDYPVLCGDNEDEFESLCSAESVGGYDKSACHEKPAALITDERECLLKTTFSHEPVLCTTNSAGGEEPTREHFHDPCIAMNMGRMDFEKVNAACDCYEYEELVHLMHVHFGQENCIEFTPPTESAVDPQVWYTCKKTVDDETDAGLRNFEAKLVAHGVYGDYPVPASLDLDLVAQPPAALSNGGAQGMAMARTAFMPGTRLGHKTLVQAESGLSPKTNLVKLSSNKVQFSNNCNDHKKAKTLIEEFISNHRILM